MKTQLLFVIALVALWVGCSNMHKNTGSANNDHDVLTGGPVTGTTIKDLPEPVKHTLKETRPIAEIADIDKEIGGGRVIYRIIFTDPARNPTMYIAEDGSIVQNMRSEKPPTETLGK